MDLDDLRTLRSQLEPHVRIAVRPETFVEAAAVLTEESRVDDERVYGLAQARGASSEPRTTPLPVLMVNEFMVTDACCRLADRFEPAELLFELIRIENFVSVQELNVLAADLIKP